MDSSSNNISTLSSHNATASQGNEGGPGFAGPSTETKVQQITTFFEDGEVIETKPAPLTRPSLLLDCHDLSENQITDVLSRPINVSNFVWSASSSALGVLAEVVCPQAFFEQPMIAQKLNGFRYASFDLCFEVQINAQPFNAGGLIGWFNPVQQQMTNGTNRLPSSTATIAGITGYPNVMWFCGDSTAMRFTVPFIGPYSHFDMILRRGTMGSFVIDILSPLTGSADATGSVWMWAENVKFDMPTGITTLPYVPATPRKNAQSGEISVGAARHRAWAEANLEKPPTAAEPTVSPKVAEKTTGLVTKLTRIGSAVAAGLGAVPVIGPFAFAASAALKGVSLFASIFGWSKPISAELPRPVAWASARSLPNYNGHSNAKVLAMDAENSTIIPTDQWRNDVDEMSLASILQKPIFTDFFVWPSAAPTGAELWRWVVDPLACKKFAGPLIGPPNSVACANTNLSYTACLFTRWRGGINYHFKFAKTAFHSARAEVLWVPGGTMDTDMSTVDKAQVYKRIYDIRDITEFDFEVPYTWFAPWKNLHVLSGIADRLNLSYDPEPTGIIVVNVLNPLRAPSTAADHIEGLVFTNAAEDFQFAIPRIPGNSYLMTRATSFPASSLTLSRINAQSAIYPTKKPAANEAAARGTGEIITSLRQVLKRGHPWNPAALSSVAAARPFKFIKNGDILSDFDPLFNRDFFAWTASFYRFFSGSMVVTINSDNAAAPGSLSIIPESDPTNPTGPNPAGPVSTRQSYMEGVTEVSVPFYQPVSMLLTELGEPYPTEGASAPSTAWTTLPRNSGTTLAVGGITGDFYRHLGEDASFGMRLGPPATWRYPIGP